MDVSLFAPAGFANADTLTAQGEMRLLKGDSSGLELFETASLLCPTEWSFFYRQAMALFEYGCEEESSKVLGIALKKCRLAAALLPDSFAVWHLWGNALGVLGKMHKELRYFKQAEDKYAQAVKLSCGQSPDVLADLHWDHGVVWLEQGLRSGEAMDLQLALQAFQKASFQQEALPAEFWHDYGRACLELSKRINDIRLLVKAINCLKHAISSSEAYYEGWLSLAEALELLYAQTHDEDHFSQANECYSSCAQLRPQENGLWYTWALFLLEAGRQHRDVKRVQNCIEKCHRAYACNPEDSSTLALWGEALSLLGELLERLDLLYEAQNKLAEAADRAPGNLFVWLHSGMSLLCFARYFQDTEYYYQAIEKLQIGLSTDRTSAPLWHALASTHGMIGHLEQDPRALERSLKFYAKTIDLKPSSYVFFEYALTLLRLGEMNHTQKWLEEAVLQFERALSIQKNAIYLHPEWLFYYASALDSLGDFYEEDSFYLRAIEILSHVLMIDPDFPQIHHRLALAYTHLGDLMGDIDPFYKAIHHYRLASKHDEENEFILLDWASTLMNITQRTADSAEAEQSFCEAEHKLIQSARLGHTAAYYTLGCLYALQNDYEKALRFLEKSEEQKALPSLEDLMHDEWLDGLRCTSGFRDFISQLEKKPHLQEENN